MASKTNKSVRFQGNRLNPAGGTMRRARTLTGVGSPAKTNGDRAGKGKRTIGKTYGNPMKPKLKANIKLSQGIGGGIKQGRGGANYVAKAKPVGATGVNQKYTIASAKRVSGAKGKTNLRPIKAQPKYQKSNPKQPKNNFTLHNTVGPADVARLRKASSFPPVKMGQGGGFKAYIGGK